MTLTQSERRTYYTDGHVRQRIGEFLGGAFPDKGSAMYFAAGTEFASQHHDALPPEELPSWLDQGAELYRSLWDRKSLICHLDIEYVNFDHPSYAFVNTERVFRLQQPVAAAVEDILSSFGITPLHLVTGRGHHFVWRVDQTSRAFAQLAALGHVPASLCHLYATALAPTGECVSPELGAAFAGLGVVMEFVAHQVKVRAAPLCELPVELGAIETGRRAEGREMISVDITEYADPLCSRTIRVPFSVYLKPAQQRADLGGEFERVPPMFMVPLDRMSVTEALGVMRDPAAVKQLAETASATIPDSSGPMKRLVAAYRRSPLARFHEQFYSEQHDAPAVWHETYDCIPLDALPPCARLILERPNDLLLRPACAQRVVRVMLALGWHPRHIAGLIRSKYERDHGWAGQWHGFDPAMRADFYARVFSGLFVTGVDDLVDFNCQSAREENLCFIGGCNENLNDFRKSLIDRRQYERLACRPFNRLFLPEEHL